MALAQCACPLLPFFCTHWGRVGTGSWHRKPERDFSERLSCPWEEQGALVWDVVGVSQEFLDAFCCGHRCKQLRFMSSQGRPRVPAGGSCLELGRPSLPGAVQLWVSPGTRGPGSERPWQMVPDGPLQAQRALIWSDLSAFCSPAAWKALRI